MGKIPFIDDMPEADEAFVRAHREELLALAAEVGITDLRVVPTGRLVGTVLPGALPLASYAYTAMAGERLETIVRLYPDYIAANPESGEDLRMTSPL